MLTAYDFLTAQILDEVEIDILLVGDSLGMLLLGYENTLPVSMEEMLHHTGAVCRGRRRALVVGDMPFASFHVSDEETIRNAARFIKTGAEAVKLEFCGCAIRRVKSLVEAGISVMGHVGLTPQLVHQMGGFRVQGRSEEQAQKLIEDAKAMEEAGVFSLVLEGIPPQVAETITKTVSIPTIGIGAGAVCDGQVLVICDLLGLTGKKPPKFVKQYAGIREEIRKATQRFKQEVETGQFPGPEHTYH